MKRSIISLLLTLFATVAYGQTMFMQRLKLSTNDSATVNIAEVRCAYEESNGTARLIYGYPNSTILTKSDYDDVLANSCGNLVNVITVQPSGTKRMAINPQWVYRVYVLSGKTKIQMREGNQIFDTPWTYSHVSEVFGNCEAGSTVSIDSISTSGDTVCITLSSSPVPVCFVVPAQQIDTSEIVVDNLLLSLTYDNEPAKVIDLSKYSHRWWSVKSAMPYYSNNPNTAFEALRAYWATRMGAIVVDTTVTLTANTTVAASVIFIGGGNISVSTGNTLTFQSSVTAEPNRWIFTGAGNYRFSQKSVTTLYPNWFGAKGDNANDDYDEIQKTINTALASQITDVEMLGGIHRTSKGLLIRNNSSTATLRFHGKTNYDGGIGTTIYCTDSTNFAIGVQGARNVDIEDLYLSGKQNAFNPTMAQIITIPEATYDNNLGRNSRYSPYSGIVIDPFKTTAPADGGYPGFTAMYDSTHSTSSNIQIRNVVVRYFIAGIMVSPTGSANGAEIDVDHMVIDRNMFGIATGSSQNRDFQVTETSIGDCKYCMIGTRFGSRTGAMPIFDNGEFGQCKFILEFNSTIGDNKVSNVYSESVWAIGNMTGRGSPLVFNNVEINFVTDDETGKQDAPCVLTCLDVPFVMDGGSLTYSDYRPVNLFCYTVFLKGVFLNRPVLNLMSNSVFEDAVKYDACKIIGYNGTQGDYRCDQEVDAVDYTNTRNVYVLRNAKIAHSEGDGFVDLYSGNAPNKATYTQVSQNKQWTIAMETKTVIVDTVARTATFTTDYTCKYRVGDILGFANSDRTPSGATSFCDIGIVSSVSETTVTCSHTPMGVGTADYAIELFEIPIFTGTWRGNVTAGSNKLVITSKPLTSGGDNATNRWPVGTRVYSKQATCTTTGGIPRGAYVASVVQDTIYLSCASDSTLAEIEFFNADLRTTFYSRDGRYQKESDTLRSVSYQRGDEMWFLEHPYRRKAVVTLGGFTPQVKFEFKNIYGMDSDKPTPEAIDTGLMYFSIDSNMVKIWNGTDWIGVGGGNVNIFNSSGSQTDTFRYFHIDSTQTFAMGQFPAFPSVSDDGTNKGYYYNGTTMGILNGSLGDGFQSSLGIGQTYTQILNKYTNSGNVYFGQYDFNAGNTALGTYENGTGNSQGITAYSDVLSSRWRASANALSEFGDSTGYFDIYQSKEDYPLRDVKYTSMSERKQGGGTSLGIAAFVGYSKGTGSPSEVTVVSPKFGFGVQRNIPGNSPAFYFNDIFVDYTNAGDTTENIISFYNNSYLWKNAKPSPTVGDTSVHVWTGNGSGTDPMFMTLDEICGHCAGSDISIYRNDDLLKAGGTTIGLDSGSLKLNLATNSGATKYGIEMTGTTATGSNRFLSMKTETDSMRIQEFGSEFYAITNKSLQFNISDQERHATDSVQWIEGSVQDVDSTRFILATTSAGWMKRFDASDLAEGDVLAVRGSNWKKVKGPIGWYRTITGTSETELFLNGSSTRAVLPATNAIWTGVVECIGSVTTVGNGTTIVVGDAVATWQPITIKRIGTSTTLMTPTLGTTVEGWIDTNMTGATFTVSADDTNEALAVKFTPPTLAGTTTVCKATCTFTFNELKF